MRCEKVFLFCSCCALNKEGSLGVQELSDRVGVALFMFDDIFEKQRAVVAEDFSAEGVECFEFADGLRRRDFE